jgi:hypothetical protein
LAEDGPIPRRYPLQELPGGGQFQRTRKNVEDSDGTLIITFGRMTGGTSRTIEFCQQLNEPYLMIDPGATSCDKAARAALEFVQGRGVSRLNVAEARAVVVQPAPGVSGL